MGAGREQASGRGPACKTGHSARPEPRARSVQSAVKALAQASPPGLLREPSLNPGAPWDGAGDGLLVLAPRLVGATPAVFVTLVVGRLGGV